MTRLNSAFPSGDGADGAQASEARDRSAPSQVCAGSDIYVGLARHQQREPWFGRDLAVTLQEWADRFNVEFKLDVSEVALRIDVLSRRCFGHFRDGHNGFGLLNEVAINARYLQGQREPWQILGTLLHELLHAWQQAHGTPGRGNYHNHEFRNKALMFGLVIDRRGRTRYLDESAFVSLLRKHAVNVPRLLSASTPERRERGKSKLKKWSCGCTNVRCATELRARCVACDREFNRAM